MEARVHNPRDGIYAATPDYVHGIELRSPSRFLFTSGTMGLGPDGGAGRTLEEQLDLVWSNLRAILASADMTTANIVRVTSYLRDASFAEKNQDARVAALEGRVVPTTTIVAQTLSPDWLIEVEIVAAA
jgi:enamine deaminase RidA (YjgF/YER057c/UK114 family)